MYDEDDESIHSNDHSDDHSENEEEADINADSNVDSNYDVDQAAHEAKMKEFKKYINIHNFDLSTVWKWMKWLGMNYSANGKTYYVDEQEEVIEDHIEFVTCYLTKYEPCCEHWMATIICQRAYRQGL